MVACGQSGSGKTHTIGTNCSKYLVCSATGLIPLAINDLFRRIKFKCEIIKVRCSFVELVDDEMYDLLQTSFRKPLEIRQWHDGSYTTNAVHQEVCSAKEAVQCLIRGSTANPTSSMRSLIFTIHLGITGR